MVSLAPQFGLDGADETSRPVGDGQQRYPKAPNAETSEKVGPGVDRFCCGWFHCDQDRLADRGDAIGDQDRFDCGAVVHLEMRPV